MALHPAVHRVDLLTRLILDPAVASDYGVEEECIAKGRGERGGAYIVRLPCGPSQRYVQKELLWPYVREFADRGIAHVSATLGALAEAGRRCELYCVHGGCARPSELRTPRLCCAGLCRPPPSACLLWNGSPPAQRLHKCTSPRKA
jgi:sucrose-phosphate synthase